VLRRRARKMLEWLRAGSYVDGAVELSVALVDDETIRALNRDYRHKDRATDVLAFAMREGEPTPGQDGGPQLLGDVIISAATAAQQARQRERPLRDELTMLLAHGLLHLLGYDHQTRREEREMTRLTEQLEQAACRRHGADAS
jgi:probable rRNA maturation factor